MKVFRSKTGPFAERPFYKSDEIETLCVDELSAVGLLPTSPAPIRIDRFIEKRFGRAHGYAQLEDGILGLTVFGPKGVQEIVISESLEDEGTKPAERRLRTTLAHEAGHGLLHTHLFALGATRPLFADCTDVDRPKVLCRDPHADRYAGRWWEVQANMVMGAILLPKPLVHLAISPFIGEPTELLGLVTLDPDKRHIAERDLAEVFHVNPIVVHYRLMQLFPVAKAGQLTL